MRLPPLIPRRWLPRGLFGRTLLIIVLPVLLMQGVASFVFFDRHWSTITRRMVEGAAGDVGLLIRLVEAGEDTTLTRSKLQAQAMLSELELTVFDDATIPQRPLPRFDPVRGMLAEALVHQVPYPFAIDRSSALQQLTVFVQVPGRVVAVGFPERRVESPTTVVFILWMMGSAVVLSGIAILFMRNQVRPIRRLARAAEAFGKGQDVPDFKPEGAREVRQAAAELLGMRDRLRRALAQRTTMLAGVSHDLRTPLTRMKLQIALLHDAEAAQELNADISEMERMIDAYLRFARDEEGEPVSALDCESLLQDLLRVFVGGSEKSVPVQLVVEDNPWLMVRPLAFRRGIGNLLTNALRHARSKVRVSLRVQGRMAEIAIEDDGPGLPPEQYEEAFRPFVRLDPARQPGTGSVGLGLTIARDIARQHGGDVVLSESPLGGLRATLRVPV